MKVYIRLSFILFLICALSAGSLALVDAATRARIQANEEHKERILRGKALAGELKGGEVTFDPEPIQVGGKDYYVGRLNGEFLGTAFTVTSNQGYGGPIEIVIGIDKTGDKIAGVRIKSFSETPGLGANAAKINYGETEPAFLAQFEGLRPHEVFLKKDDPNGMVDAITAATITSRAVTNSVREGAMEFEKDRKELEEKE